MKNFGVTVVVTNKNYERYIENCILSVLEQQGVPTELVVVDDASEDGSWGLIESLSKEYGFLALRNEKQMGVSFSRNLGVSRGTKSHILYVDGDDWIENPQFMRQLRQSIRAHLDKDFFQIFDQGWDEIHQKWVFVSIVAVQDLFHVYSGNLGNFCFSRKAFDQLGGFDTRFYYGWEDWDFWFRGLHRFGWVSLPDIQGYVWRVNKPEGSRSNLAKNPVEFLKLLRLIFEVHPHMRNHGVWYDGYVVYPEYLDHLDKCAEGYAGDFHEFLEDYGTKGVIQILVEPKSPFRYKRLS